MSSKRQDFKSKYRKEIHYERKACINFTLLLSAFNTKDYQFISYYNGAFD